MRRTIPVIRASALVPLVNLLTRDRHPVASMLRDAGLGFYSESDPLLAVPVRNVEQFVLLAAEAAGSDVGFRCVESSVFHEMEGIGRVIRRASSPRDAMNRVTVAMPFHCSHEIVAVTAGDQDSVFHEYWTMDMDPDALHIIQQIVVSILRLVLRKASPSGTVMKRVLMVPHSRDGLSHSIGYLGIAAEPNQRPSLDVVVPNEVLDAPFLPAARDAGAREPIDWVRLRNGTLEVPARRLVAAMMGDGTPTIERLAKAADMSVRTLQRRLAEEGVTFSDLVESVREEVAMDQLSRGELAIGEVAARLGYSKQSSLTRAVKRWTGEPPIEVRARLGRKGPKAG